MGYWGLFRPCCILRFFSSLPLGSPARTVGWRDPGFIHTSFLKNLWPNVVYAYKDLCPFLFLCFCLWVLLSIDDIFLLLWWFFRYIYRMGHRLVDGSFIWSKFYSFRSSPYPGQDSLQRVIIFGDMGKVLLIVVFICRFLLLFTWVEDPSRKRFWTMPFTSYIELPFVRLLDNHC